MYLFPPLSPEVRLQMDGLVSLIDKVFPLPRRFHAALPRDVAELSRLFTSGRRDRGLSYLGRPNLLSAYLRFFLPWNVYRLCRLLPSLSLDLKPGDRILDLGAGPLTFVLALWLCRPDLRSIPLEFHCLDRTVSVLEAGKKIFSSLADTNQEAQIRRFPSAWTIRTIKGEIAGKKIRIEPAALVTAINVFNEIFWEISPANRGGLKNLAKQSAGLLASYGKDGTILVAEPGIPRSGEFISSLRSSLLERGLAPISPCPHRLACPFPGGLARKKAKWCHFSFDTADAAPELLKLSAAAGIPKDRAVLSFLLAKKSPMLNAEKPKAQNARIISDPFPVGPYYGRYACSDLGAVLVRGSREKIEALDSGTRTEIKIGGDSKNPEGHRDLKSGALIGELF